MAEVWNGAAKNNPSISISVLCGHITSKTLVEKCREQLGNGQVELKCPKCKKVWPYGEVRTLLNSAEQLYFKDGLWENAAKKMIDIKGCPSCSSFIERKDSSDLCVQCPFCTLKTGKSSEFCWQCGQAWKGPRPRTDKCENLGCSNSDIKILKDCKMITLPHNSQNMQCPSIRACPHCGTLIEHTKEGCNMMTCFNCRRPFCFVCLRCSGCLSSGVAPRQTSIP